MELRKEVVWFAEEMEKQLKANDHKGGWKREEFDYLVERIDSKVLEFGYTESDDEAFRIAVAIANYAMMIADNIRGERKDENLNL